MKMAVFFCFLCMLMVFAAQSAQAGTLYRWVDANGNVHFTDQPPPQNAKDIQEKRLASPTQSNGQTPYSTLAASRNFPVTLYITNCGDTCTRARDHLSKRGIPFSEKNPTEPAVAEALKKLIGAVEIPVLIVGKASPIKGFSAESWDAALDVAGYPKASAAKPAASPSKPEQKTEAQDSKPK
jgi:hypothetical protein